MSENHIPDRVLLVGAGPVGLTAALELALRGVRVAVIDPSTDPASKIHPRARSANLRSTQHLRRLGVSDLIRNTSAFRPDWGSDVQFRTTLSGYEIARFEDALYSSPERNDLYPEPSIQIQQRNVEIAIRSRLADFDNVETYYGWSVVGVRQDDEAAYVTIESETGEQTELAGRYVIGSDGGGSTIRRQFGFEMIGEKAISRNIQVLFNAPDLYRDLDLTPAAQYWCLCGNPPGFVQSSDDKGFFVLSIHKVQDPEAFDQERAIAAVEAAIGTAYPIEYIGLDHWTIHAYIARTYRIGRAFVVGDAGRQHATYGGHGMNVGLHDAVDLGWKLAAVMQGWAPEALLDTFTEERRPVGQHVLDLATAQFAQTPRELNDPLLQDDSEAGAAARERVRQVIERDKRAQFRHIGVQMGYSYKGSSLIVSDGQEPPEWVPNDYVPSAVPGSIAPHAWLADGTSLYDHFGPWFTVLVTDASAVEAGRALVAAAAERNVPAELVVVDEEKVSRLYEAPLLVIRPDQHVAARFQEPPADAAAIWEQVAGRLVMADA